MLRRAALLFFLVLSAYALAAGQSQAITVKPTNSDPAARPPELEKQVLPPHIKPADLDGRQSLTNPSRMQLIRLLDAEFVHSRKFIPIADKTLIIADDGTVKPGDDELYRMAQTNGAAAKVGDRVQITNIIFKPKSIYLEINGGPKKKTKWYQHIEVGIGSGSNGSSTAATQATGAALTIEFKNHVPEMTGPELQQLLTPVLDFSVKSAAQIFADALPPKIRQAVKSHEVLVGMNHDMVVMAKDRPQQKVRDKDAQGHPYEEWIYGTPPQDVTFVRFVGDEVVLVKIARPGGETVVKTQKEVDIVDGVPTLASLESSDSPQDEKGGPQPEQPAHRPTLKLPGEQTEQERQQQQQQQNGDPNAQAPHQEEPQWGTGGSKQPDASQQTPPDASQQQPPAQQPPPEPELQKRPPL